MAYKGLYGTLVACLVAITIGVAPAGAAPAPCGAPQITDVAGDGHHINTDVTSAWLSEQTGRLQAVIKVNQAVWEPAHDDSQFVSVAFLFNVGGQTRYVRVEAPRPADGPIKYDYGTWAGGGAFLSAGPTVGVPVSGPGGTITLDVPGETGAVAGAVLTQLFVLTWDGVSTEPHWVDRAPGGVTPAGTEFGADYRVGACGDGPGGGASGQSVASIQLKGRKKIVGGGTTTVTGSISPVRGGVPVELTAKARKSSVRRLVTKADGTFKASVPVSETTQFRAVAGGVSSQTHTITVAAKVRIKVRRLRGGRVLIRGKVRPKLPGRVLLLRTTSPFPTARTKARKGRFTFRFKKLRRGRYQAVFIPSKGRAERATSNKGAVR